MLGKPLGKDSMDFQILVSDLKAERNRIEHAISALERLASRSSARSGRPGLRKNLCRFKQRSRPANIRDVSRPELPSL